MLPKFRFTDKQIVRLQETPDDIPDGGTPHTLSLLMHDKLVVEVIRYQKMLCDLKKDANMIAY